MSATMYGCEIVCSLPIGRAASAYAPSRRSSGTKSSRGTRPIAASTRSSSMPRRRSCDSTIPARSSADTRERLHRTRHRDTEVREHGRSDVRDPVQLGLEPDGHDRHERVARDERAVAAAARVVAAAQIGELPALRGGDEKLAGVRVRESGTRAMGSVRMLELLEELVDWAVCTAAASDDLVPLEAKRDIHGREAVQPPRQLARVDSRLREEIDLAGAVRGSHDDLSFEIREGLLQTRRASDRGLAVIGEQHDRVALEELVRPAGCVEERCYSGVGLLERAVGGSAVGPGRVRYEVVAGQVEGEEVEAVAGDEPPPDRGGVRVDRPAAATAHRERRSGPVRLEQAVEEEATRPVRGAADAGERRQVAMAA